MPLWWLLAGKFQGELLKQPFEDGLLIIDCGTANEAQQVNPSGFWQGGILEAFIAVGADGSELGLRFAMNAVPAPPGVGFIQLNEDGLAVQLPCNHTRGS